MALTDIDISWVLAGAVLLFGLLLAAVLLTRGKKPSGQHADNDSWERLEAARRRRERIYAFSSYALLFCCAGVAAALSFQGLVGFGRQNLGLSDGWEYLVPFGLDGAAMFCAVLAVREASHGDSSMGSRILVWLFAGASAWFNWVHAPRGAEHAGAPQFFAGMSLAAAVLFDRALKQTRRSALREQGLVPRPLPQIRFARWLRAPRETYGAWSLMLLENVRSLDEAVEEVREERNNKRQARMRRREQRAMERARLRALSRQHGVFGRRRAVEVPAAPEPAALEAGSTTRRAALHAPGEEARGGRGEDPTSIAQAAPRLDSLEEKLARIERQFG